jgi:hypothetical protein
VEPPHLLYRELHQKSDISASMYMSSSSIPNPAFAAAGNTWSGFKRGSAKYGEGQSLAVEGIHPHNRVELRIGYMELAKLPVIPEFVVLENAATIIGSVASQLPFSLPSRLLPVRLIISICCWDLRLLLGTSSIVSAVLGCGTHVSLHLMCIY